MFLVPRPLLILLCEIIHVLMRDEKEGKKKKVHVHDNKPQLPSCKQLHVHVKLYANRLRCEKNRIAHCTGHVSANAMQASSAVLG